MIPEASSLKEQSSERQGVYMEASQSQAERRRKDGVMQDAGSLGFGGGKWHSGQMASQLSTCRIIS